MTTNMAKLRGKIGEANISREAVAEAMGIDRSTFYRRLRSDGTTFTVGEVHKLVEIVGLSPKEAYEIFLNE